MTDDEEAERRITRIERQASGGAPPDFPEAAIDGPVERSFGFLDDEGYELAARISQAVCEIINGSELFVGTDSVTCPECGAEGSVGRWSWPTSGDRMETDGGGHKERRTGCDYHHEYVHACSHCRSRNNVTLEGEHHAPPGAPTEGEAPTGVQEGDVPAGATETVKEMRETDVNLVTDEDDEPANGKCDEPHPLPCGVDIKCELTDEERDYTEYVTTPSSWNRYWKTHPTWAIRLPTDVTVPTSHGDVEGEEGDYLCISASGSLYPCDGETFEEMYQRTPPEGFDG